MLFLDNNSFEIRETKEKGKGIFSKNSLPPGKIIGDYTGLVIHPKDADEYEKGKHFYLMYYHDYAGIFPDLTTPDLYLINHSCTPNAWIYTYKGHTLFFTLRHIFPGEELTISYLLSPKDAYCEPCNHICKCESNRCTTSMHLSKDRYETWQKAYTRLSSLTQKERVRKWKYLKLLSEYPSSIPDDPVYALFGNQTISPKILETKILPDRSLLREAIRKTGRTLLFPDLNLRVVGVVDEEVIMDSE